ncbi:neuron navigator 1 isoform X1 [Tachysurus ichikawai]
MSARIKPVTKDHSGSGIPLPQTMGTFSKQSTKCSSSSFLSSPAQYHSGGRMTSSSSSTSSIITSKELLKEASSRIQYQLQRPTPHKTSFNHMTGSRSAYSSPQVPKRDMLRSKDTLDLRRLSVSQDRYRDLTRNGNKNWKTNQVQFKSLDNADAPSSSCLTTREVQTGKAGLSTTNGNLIWGSSSGNRAGFNKQRIKFKNGSTVKDINSCKRTPQIAEGSESPRMVAVAPFRFKLQVQEDTDMSSLEDVSDCSSDSMEVCCEDLEPCHTQVSCSA